MITTPYLRSQSKIKNDIAKRMRDVSNVRWSTAEIYQAINDALLEWPEYLQLGAVYTLPNGWVNGTYEYALPAYIRPPIQPQIKRYVPFNLYQESATNVTWTDIKAFETEPDGDGGLKLRLNSIPYTEDGRIIWFIPQSPLPEVIPSLNAEIDSDDTSLVLSTTNLDIADSGYIYIDAEWLLYAGVTRGASTTTLSNLERGLYSTTAATHSSGADVEFGVAADELSLFQQLYHQVYPKLHAYFLTDGSEHERRRHAEMMLYYDKIVMEYWKRRVPSRSPSMVLGSEMVLDGLTWRH